MNAVVNTSVLTVVCEQYRTRGCGSIVFDRSLVGLLRRYGLPALLLLLPAEREGVFVSKSPILGFMLRPQWGVMCLTSSHPVSKHNSLMKSTKEDSYATCTL
jgi:hypothetical protein